MLFNSLDFAIFLPIFFVLYWFVTQRSLLWQNRLIVVASLIFYGWWDWRFLSLLLLSAMVDFYVGIRLLNEVREKVRRNLLGISVTVNLGLLGFFKYFNFFIENFKSAFSFFGHDLNITALHIILPVGISFYSFQTLSYTIDVYRRNIEPTKDFTAFLAFVSFFPQLVAGPIERASHLLPQFYVPRRFDYETAVGGMRLILWGFFKKIVIADKAAYYVNDIFEHYDQYSGGTLVMGAFLFSFQIYGDFSGYSDIAVGLSRLFGFNLMRNFNYPYFSRNTSEFWQRWHISLSTWFRDYLYLPLGGNRGNMLFRIRNVFIVFVVSGFWHGANWTFLFWGAINALLFIPLLTSKNRKANFHTSHPLIPGFVESIQMLGTFVLITFTWIFFRAESLSQAFSYIRSIFVSDDFFKISSQTTFTTSIIPLLGYLIFFVTIEWLNRQHEYIIHPVLTRPTKLLTAVRYSLYFLILLVIILNVRNQASDFIYFQF